MIGHEEGVEFSCFELLDEGFDVFEVEVGVGVGTGISPCASVKAHWPHKCCEVQLRGFGPF